jgi:alpha-tubulin suppressor-like RCC1 family protein
MRWSTPRRVRVIVVVVRTAETVVFVACLALPACGARSALEPGESGGSPGARDAGTSTRSFVAIAARGSSACALRADGALFCWGNNASAQLGMVTSGIAVAPTRVDALEKVLALSLGGEFGCAQTAAGLLCFGHNNFGQIGAGDVIGSRLPSLVDGLPSELRGFSAGGTHACAVDVRGALYCWGNNGWGEIGIGFASGTDTSYSVSRPARVELGNVSAVAAGEVHTCAVVDGGELYCWGGRASEPSYPSPGPPLPVARGSVPPLRKIVAGNEFTCAVSENGWVGCMGPNASVSGAAELSAVDGLSSQMVDVACGWEHACAVAGDGSVWCWGMNRRGALGRDPTHGDNFDPVPRRVSGIPGHAIAVAVGTDFSCVLAEDSTVWCWGSQDFAQLGVVREHPVDSPSPTRVPLE